MANTADQNYIDYKISLGNVLIRKFEQVMSESGESLMTEAVLVEVTTLAELTFKKMQLMLFQYKEKMSEKNFDDLLKQKEKMQGIITKLEVLRKETC